MPDSLSAADRSSLVAEKGPVNMTVTALLICESGPGLTYDAITQRITERIHLLTRYQQRLQEPTIGLVHPVWVDDEHFDVHWHVRHATLPAPGGEAELSAYIGREASRRLDRSRPLWELHVVDGLADGNTALVVKMHHALVDGMSAVGIAMVLLDFTAEPMPVEPAPAQAAARPYALGRHIARLATGQVSTAQKVLLRATEKLVDTAMSPRTAETDLRKATEVLAAFAKLRNAATPLPFNRPISANRSYAYTSVGLAEVKAASKRSGGTVNDTILAVVAGMVARYLKSCGVDASLLKKDPVSLVPVNIRRPGENETSGNRIAVVFVDLPVGEPDLAKRIAMLAERTNKIKGSADVIAGAFAVDATGFAPPLLTSALAAVPVPGGGGGAIQNIVVSNVPGPQAPLWVSGSKVLAIHPVLPLNPADQGIGVAVFSYNGVVHFGVTTDKNLDPPVGVAATALQESIDELVALADL